jgi:hypothetical protein
VQVNSEHNSQSDYDVLLQFFTPLVGEKFSTAAGISDSEVSGYIAQMLSDFCDTEQLFKIRDSAGRRLTDVGEMLLESDPVYGPAPSFDRERQVRKHIGDFTLFFAGMFPESINHYRLRRQRLESFVDFIRAGKESYYIVSQFDLFEYTKVAPLFKKLSERFEDCVFALNVVKQELDLLQHPITRRAQKLLM